MRPCVNSSFEGNVRTWRASGSPGPPGLPALTCTRVKACGTVMLPWQTCAPGRSLAAGIVGTTPIVKARSRSSRVAVTSSATSPRATTASRVSAPPLRIEAPRDDGEREELEDERGADQGAGRVRTQARRDEPDRRRRAGAEQRQQRQQVATLVEDHALAEQSPVLDPVQAGEQG